MPKRKKLLVGLGTAVLALFVATAAFWGSALADSGCVSTLTGFQPNRFVIDGGGCIHMNGSDAYDGADKGTTLARATYDFTVQGGAAGTVNLGINNGTNQAIVLPNNAVILDGVLDVVTSFTESGAPLISLTANSAGDVMTTLDPATLTAGRHAISPVSIATSLKTTAARTLTATIGGTGSITAGKAVLFLRYFVSG